MHEKSMHSIIQKQYIIYIQLNIVQSLYQFTDRDSMTSVLYITLKFLLFSDLMYVPINSVNL